MENLYHSRINSLNSESFSMFFNSLQFLFLCNPQKSRASRVYTTLPQITQKILTTDIIHWLELITVIMHFLRYSVWEKQRLSFFIVAENLLENQRKHFISGFLGPLKIKLRMVHETTYIVSFLLDSKTVFHLLSIVSTRLYLLFKKILLLWLLRGTFYSLQRSISLQSTF